MRTLLSRFRAALPILAVSAAIASAAPIPTASADGSACVVSGETQQYCEQSFINALNMMRADRGREPLVYGTPKATGAIELGNQIVADLTANPTADGVRDEAQFLMTAQGDNPSADQALYVVEIAVHWLGQPGLEKTIDAALAAANAANGGPTSVTPIPSATPNHGEVGGPLS